MLPPEETTAHSEPSAVPPDERGRGRPSPLADPALIHRVRAREPRALATFHEHAFDLVYGLVHRLLGDRTLAEDATSEVFLKVYRAIERLDPERDPSPWLVTIATNVCRDLWRSGAYRTSRRAADVNDEAVADRLASGERTPEQHLLAGERERAVQQALMDLPEPLRLAVVLHDWQGLGHHEIAELTGIAHDAARKRYSRALALLAKRLKDVL